MIRRSAPKRVTRVRRRNDAGAVTILFAAGIAAIIMIIAVSVDVSGSLRASFRARALAEQAARAGADQISIQAALAGDDTEIDTNTLQTAACGPATLPPDAKCVGAASVGPGTVTVTVTLTYHSLLSSMFGYTDEAQTATATALLIQSTPPPP